MKRGPLLTWLSDMSTERYRWWVDSFRHGYPLIGSIWQLFHFMNGVHLRKFIIMWRILNHCRRLGWRGMWKKAFEYSRFIRVVRRWGKEISWRGRSKVSSSLPCTSTFLSSSPEGIRYMTNLVHHLKDPREKMSKSFAFKTSILFLLKAWNSS